VQSIMAERHRVSKQQQQTGPENVKWMVSGLAVKVENWSRKRNARVRRKIGTSSESKFLPSEQT
jgi:hypothetical protein